MIEVLNLALPYFGLIFLGYFFGKLKKLPEIGLAWMNFFILYVALPALFYRIVAQTPFEQLNNVPFVVATTLGTAAAFGLSFAIAVAIRLGHMGGSTIAALAGSYGNIGYMGPGLALATLGPAAAVPVALIFCFDSIFLFSITPLLMALSGTEKKGAIATTVDVIRQIVLHPLILATGLGVIAAAANFEAPVALDRLLQFLHNAAAPAALFTLGVTVALRPLERMPWEVPALLVVKLLIHPALALLLLSLFAPFEPSWVYTAVLMAALPPALNVFVLARQYETWVEQASNSVLFGTMASVVTLTAVMWLVKNGMLPQDLLR
jgi:malonate transporter